jgi:hypothetical protein
MDGYYLSLSYKAEQDTLPGILSSLNIRTASFIPLEFLGCLSSLLVL